MIDVVIHGSGKLGQMVFHLLAADPGYRVVAFTADQQYCTQETLHGVPLVPFDTVHEQFRPDAVAMLTVLGGLGGWAPRKELFDRARAKGYRHLNYVHPAAIVQGERDWGTNNIVFPFATIGFGGRMGDGNIVREKAYLGHDFTIGDHAFLGVGCTIGGGSQIGSGAYVAMSATVTDHITIGEGAMVGIGSLLLREAEPETRYYGHPAKKASPREPNE